MILQKCRQVTGRRRGQRLRHRGGGRQPGRVQAGAEEAAPLHAVAERLDQDRLQGVHARHRRQVDRRPGGARRSSRSTSPTSRAATRRAKTPTLRHNRSFDDKTGYRARSMLTVPMLSAIGEVIGVVQLINKKRDPARPLTPGQFDRRRDPLRSAGRGAGARPGPRRRASRWRTRSSTTRSAGCSTGSSRRR